MGLCISYRGQLKKPEMVYELIKDMKEICTTMEWDYVVKDDDWTQTNNVKYVEHFQLEGKIHLKGIAFRVHPRCDAMFLFFDNRGIIMSEHLMAMQQVLKESDEMPWQWSKTSNAGIVAHIKFCNLIDYIKKRYFEILEVKDDTEYYATRDLEGLKANFMVMSTVINAFESGGAGLLEKILDIKIKEIKPLDAPES